MPITWATPVHQRTDGVSGDEMGVGRPEVVRDLRKLEVEPGQQRQQEGAVDGDEIIDGHEHRQDLPLLRHAFFSFMDRLIVVSHLFSFGPATGPIPLIFPCLRPSEHRSCFDGQEHVLSAVRSRGGYGRARVRSSVLSPGAWGPPEARPPAISPRKQMGILIRILIGL